MVIDSQLTMAAHVSSLSRVFYFQLQQLRPVARLLSAEAAKSLAQAFSCHLDYCNAMFYGISHTLFERWASIQNAAAHLLAAARRREHISLVLKQFHWLPVQRRIAYKL